MAIIVSVLNCPWGKVCEEWENNELCVYVDGVSHMSSQQTYGPQLFDGLLWKSSWYGVVRHGDESDVRI